MSTGQDHHDSLVPCGYTYDPQAGDNHAFEGRYEDLLEVVDDDAEGRYEDLLEVVDDDAEGAVWRCRRRTTPDADGRARCPFHADPDERDVTDEELAQAFLALVRDEDDSPLLADVAPDSLDDPNGRRFLRVDLPDGESPHGDAVARRRKMFCGARFGEVNLSREVFDAPDRYPIDLRGARMASLDCAEAEIGSGITAPGLVVAGATTFEAAVVGGDFVLADARVGILGGDPAPWPVLRGSVEESGEPIVDGVVNRVATWSFVLDRVSVDGRVEFGASHCGGEVSLQSAEVAGELSLESAEVGAMSLVRADVGEWVTLRNADIGSWVSFRDACVDQFVSFEETTAGENVSFVNADIGELVSMKNADVGGCVALKNADIGELVSMKNADVRKTDFERANVGGRVELHGADVGREVSFLLADVDSVSLKGAEIGMATFVGVDTVGVVRLNDIRAATVNLDYAEVGGVLGVSLKRAEVERVRLCHAQVEADVSFGGAAVGKGVSLDGADVGGEVSFGGATVGREVSLDGADVGGEVSFGGATVGREVSLDGADVGGEVSFGGVDVGGYLSLEDVDVGDAVSLKGAFVSGEVSFDGGATEGALSLDGADVDGDVSLRSVEVGEEVSLKHATVAGTATLAGATADRIQLRGSTGVEEDLRCDGVGATAIDIRTGEDTSDADATPLVTGSVTADGAAVKEFEIERGCVRSVVDLGGLDATDLTVRAREPVDSVSTPVGLREARVDSVTVDVDPDLAAARSGPLVYDVAAGRVGDISLSERDRAAFEDDLYDHVRFLGADFSALDFSTERDRLFQNDWNLHGLVGDDETGDDDPDHPAERAVQVTRLFSPGGDGTSLREAVHARVAARLRGERVPELGDALADTDVAPVDAAVLYALVDDDTRTPSTRRVHARVDRLERALDDALDTALSSEARLGDGPSAVALRDALVSALLERATGEQLDAPGGARSLRAGSVGSVGFVPEIRREEVIDAVRRRLVCNHSYPDREIQADDELPSDWKSLSEADFDDVVWSAPVQNALVGLVELVTSDDAVVPVDPDEGVVAPDADDSLRVSPAVAALRHYVGNDTDTDRDPPLRRVRDRLHEVERECAHDWVERWMAGERPLGGGELSPLPALPERAWNDALVDALVEDSPVLARIDRLVSLYDGLVPLSRRTDRGPPTMTLDELEATYTAAKTAADEGGENVAASAFFRREHRYIQLQNRRNLRREATLAWHALPGGESEAAPRDDTTGTDPDSPDDDAETTPTEPDGPGSRATDDPDPRNFARYLLAWLSNAVLRTVAGYGESPRRVLGWSAVVILVWPVLYLIAALARVGTPLTRPEAVARNAADVAGSHGLDLLLLSVASFTTVIPAVPVLPGSDAPTDLTNDWWINALSSVEGLLGVLALSLFVVTLTRSVQR